MKTHGAIGWLIVIQTLVTCHMVILARQQETVSPMQALLIALSLGLLARMLVEYWRTR